MGSARSKRVLIKVKFVFWENFIQKTLFLCVLYYVLFSKMNYNQGKKNHWSKYEFNKIFKKKNLCQRQIIYSENSWLPQSKFKKEILW